VTVERLTQSPLGRYVTNLERNGSMLRFGPDLDGQAEFFEAPNETSVLWGFVSALEMVGTRFVVCAVIFQKKCSTPPSG